MLAPHEGEPVADWLRGLGWSSRVIHYPVQSRTAAPEGLQDGPLLAVQAAVRAERARGAEVVGVLGFSAGGHLAGQATLLPSADEAERPDFAVLCYPVCSMVTPTHGGSRTNLLGPDPAEQQRRDTSLELMARPDSRPVFLWHTADDESVPVADHPLRLAAALAAVEAPVELHVFEHGVHGLGLAEAHPAGAWTGLCARWLEQF